MGRDAPRGAASRMRAASRPFDAHGRKKRSRAGARRTFRGKPARQPIDARKRRFIGRSPCFVVSFSGSSQVGGGERAFLVSEKSAEDDA
eukprot:30828-Pelagococcus_subviridis.AAC.29